MLQAATHAGDVARGHYVAALDGFLDGVADTEHESTYNEAPTQSALMGSIGIKSGGCVTAGEIALRALRVRTLTVPSRPLVSLAALAPNGSDAPEPGAK